MYLPLSDDEHGFVQKVRPARANGHCERGCNSNQVATLPHAINLGVSEFCCPGPSTNAL